MSDLPSPHEEPAPFDARLFEPPPWVTERLGTSGTRGQGPQPASASVTGSDDGDALEDAMSDEDLGIEESIEGLTRFSTEELKASETTLPLLATLTGAEASRTRLDSQGCWE